MITVWGNADSVNVQKVLWTCEELALDYERIDAGRHFGVVGMPEFRELNPNGLVPTIADDGYVVWESNTIVRYLAGRYANDGLLPIERETLPALERWFDRLAARPAFRKAVMTPLTT